MLRLWGRTSSINVRKVLWTLQELGLPFERIDAGLAYGHNHTPDYLAKNPNALVPLLEDGDFTLWESNAIVRYLCARHAAATLYPEDLRTRFDAERWMDWQQTTLNRAGGPAFIQWIRTPAEQRTAVIAQSVAATEPLLALLDAHLARGPGWRASTSPWPTSRSAVKSTAGGACRSRARRCHTWRAGTPPCRRAPPPVACWTCR
jgi:glutathione S-transferase